MKQPLRWAVFMGTSMTIIEGARSIERAKMVALEQSGLGSKPWLARDWRVRLATADDVARYEAHLRKSPPEYEQESFT